MSTHPTSERLDDYLCGRLDELQCEEVERHLNACPECSQVTMRRQPDDELSDLLKAANQSSVQPIHDNAAVTADAGSDSTAPRQSSEATERALSASPAGLESHSQVNDITVFKQSEADVSDEWQSLTTQSFVTSGLADLWSGESLLKEHPRYEVVRPLGRGGMGIVWLARHKTMDRLVALKMIRPSSRSGEQLINWFRQETRHISRLNHPNIVAAYDAEDTADGRFIVFEYIDGETYAQIARRQALEPADALYVIRTVAVALSYAHEIGLVHRDIKPGNLIRDRQGVIKILDFGIASEVESNSDTNSTDLKQTIGPVGTLPYLAPECFQAAPPSTLTDIYALGCTLFHLLVGHPPNAARESSEQLASPLSKHAELARFSPKICLLIEQMTARDPSRRLASTHAVVEQIDRIIAADPTLSKQVTKIAPSKAGQWNRRRMLAVAGCGSILATVPIGALWWQRFKGGAVDPYPVTPDKPGHGDSAFSRLLDRFGPGTDTWLVEPSKLGDGQADDFHFDENRLSIRVYGNNRQAWLNFQNVNGHRISLYSRIELQRYQPGFSCVKFAFLNNWSSECNFQWTCNMSTEMLQVEFANSKGLEKLWKENLASGSGFTAEIALHMTGSSLNVTVDDTERTTQSFEDAESRFPAIAAFGCDVNVWTLARVHDV